MKRRLGMVTLTWALGGCAALPSWSPFGTGQSQETHAADTGPFSFSWELSGDPEVSPLQVFDNGRSTWLQFPQGRPVPAIFRRHQAQWLPVDYTLKGSYVVLPGAWSPLQFRGGHLQSQARRTPAPAESAAIEKSPINKLPTVPALTEPASSAAAAAVPPATAALLPSPAVQASRAFTGVLAQPAVAFALNPVAPVKATKRYAVSPADKTLRQALVRWAGDAGWTFGVEHWAVDADIPLAGSAHFDGEFTVAVRHLLAATELSERPLQPCFYSNQVLRVVPYAQACDRTAGSPARAS
ncbi:MAG: TcpQ domain-containing protein [Burkholderiaceae bacterium]